MEKKNRPLQAANSDTRVSDVTPLTKSLQAPKRTPKKHRARVYMLRTGIEGWTENDILRYCRLSSGRNYATELERQLGITLERIDEKNPDGIGTHLRYRFSCRGDVLKVITHINHLANINDHNGLSQQEIADILKLYPDAFNAASRRLKMNIEKSRLISEAAPHLNASLGTINGNEFAAIVPVIPGHIGGRETNIVSAKALHKALGVGKDFSTWITDRISEYDFTIGHDYSVHKTISPNLGKSPNGAAYSKIKQSGRPGKDYLLSVGMAKELAMIERNDQGRAIRRYFIQCEEELQRSVPEIAARYRRQLKARISAANNFKPMCDALNMARAEQGKTTQQHHYTNESNMISRIVLGGLTAKQWARINGYSGEPRDHMNAEQLEHLSYLESTNITLIDMGMEYEQRKGELTRLSQRWLAKRLEAVHV